MEIFDRKAIKKKENTISSDIERVVKKKENTISSDIEEYIEKHIEKKLNNLLETLPGKLPNLYNIKPIYELSIKELYKNTLQNTIDIINDFTDIYSKNDYNTNNNYYLILNILTKDDRKIYVGIIIMFLSFIIYFIDGVSI